jgi:hypothetical protein
MTKIAPYFAHCGWYQDHLIKLKILLQPPFDSVTLTDHTAEPLVCMLGANMIL